MHTLASSMHTLYTRVEDAWKTRGERRGKAERTGMCTVTPVHYLQHVLYVCIQYCYSRVLTSMHTTVIILCILSASIHTS